jgi:hypothetical protein
MKKHAKEPTDILYQRHMKDMTTVQHRKYY